MQGRIIKGIAGFYYVSAENQQVYECKAKGIFRKEKLKPLVGDFVELEILDEEDKKGNVIAVLERKNTLIRPAVANIDQALVILRQRSQILILPCWTVFDYYGETKDSCGNLYQ